MSDVIEIIDLSEPTTVEVEVTELVTEIVELDAEGPVIVDIAPFGERGVKGEKGDKGDPSIYVGDTPPTDPPLNALWLDTS